MAKKELMYQFTLLFLCSFLLSTSVLAKDPTFHRVPALEGDNIYTLLERYELEKYDCNFKQFYKLNDLNSESHLVANKRYYIPVLIYAYNGKSIRTTLGIKTWEHAVRIKKYNERMRDRKLRRSTIAKSSILWVGFHEMNCDVSNAKKSKEKEKEVKVKKEEVEDLTKRINEQAKIDEKILERDAKISGYRKFPIFGKKNAYIPLLDNKLRGKVFYVVSGHGGPDSGAVGKAGKRQLCEDEYAYDVSLRVVRNLLQHGAIAYMITRDPNDGLRSGEYLPCDRDEYCWGNYRIPRSQKTRLYQRSDAINELYKRHLKQGIKDQTMISIHIDSRNTSETTDVFFYHFPGSKSGRKLAKGLQRTFRNKYKQYRKNGKYNGSVTGRDLHMLREVKTNAVFVELGNIRNAYDQQRFMKENNRQALANWLFEGLIK